MTLLTLLDRLEAAGNRLPPPAWLFVWLCGGVAVLSLLAALAGWQAQLPDGSTVAALNLLSLTGLNLVLTETVTNFTGFAPVGPVLVAMLGIGLAEQSGLLGAALAALVRATRGRFLPFITALAGVLSSLAVDAGYVVVIPLAGLLFLRAGLPPLAGIACAFAGVSGGFSANLLIGPVDAMLTGIATEAARTVDAQAQVPVTASWYFMMASTLLVSGVIAVVTQRLVLRRLPAPAAVRDNDASPALDARGARAVLVWTLLVAAGLLAGLLPADGVLRSATGGVTDAPVLKGLVVVIAVYAAVAGLLYGRLSGQWSRASAIVPTMEDTLRTLAGYLVLMFFAAQFVAWFKWSQLGPLVAVTGADGLRALALPPVLLLISFVLFTALLNLLVGSASAKWALLAPVFLPMFMLAGIAPDATLTAYRVGDSVSNIVTPLMPYFAMVVAFAQRFDARAGIGTLMALMLPYSLTLLLAWGGFLALWLTLGLPLGPG